MLAPAVIPERFGVQYRTNVQCYGQKEAVTDERHTSNIPQGGSRPLETWAEHLLPSPKGSGFLMNTFFLLFKMTVTKIISRMI